MSYQPSSREPHWQQYWESQQTYAFNLHDTSRPVYSIDTPPPTVSGSLHIGHIFSYIQAELIARYKRMKWYNVYYPMWYDDNGIPTELLVEKELWIDIKTTPRAQFVEQCLDITAKYRSIYQQLRKMFGISVDRDQQFSTISPFVQGIAQQRFVELYQQWVIKRKSFPALRCRATQSTTAQSELEEKEQESLFHHIRFEVVGGWEIIIATTRPELMPACVAVVVHPEDSRYISYIDKIIKTPFWLQIPIITDIEMKMDKGTGAMMCCSYGDEHDMQIIISRNITPRIIVGKSGKIEWSGIPELEWLKTHQARIAIIPLLKATWALIKSEPITQSIKYTERGKVPVEIIPIEQWFVDTLAIKDSLHSLSDDMKRWPGDMSRKLDSWIDGLARDRNISRNRSFGIPIPVRHSLKTGEIILPDPLQLPIDPLATHPLILPPDHTLDDITGETLVLDTRFTSGLTPDIHQANITSKGSALSLFPFSLRPQAHEIIRTRLFYTTTQSRYHHQAKPFENIMVSGRALAAKGEKFSKSAGNSVYDPATLVQKYSADAVRYWCLSSQLGKDTFFEENEIKVWHKLVNKLRNASQFVKLQLGEWFIPDTEYIATVDTDRWILSRLYETISTMTIQLDFYEWWLAKQAFEDFFWNDFCDTYIELIKSRVYQPETLSDGISKQYSARQTLYKVFDTIVRLIAPYLPHITEEIYHSFIIQYHTIWSIHVRPYPCIEEISPTIIVSSPQLSTIYHIVSEIIGVARKYKTDHQLSLSTPIPTLSITLPSQHIELLKGWNDDIIGITKAQTLIVTPGNNMIIDI